MKTNDFAQIISIGGIFTALAVLFQSSPVFLPGIGLILSPFATLPIALAALVSAYSGILAFLVSGFILLLINPQEAVIFLLTTGPLGLTLGLSYTKGIIPSIGIPGGILFVGIIIMTHIAGISVFGSMVLKSSPIIDALVFILFSVIYSGIWLLILRFILKVLKRASYFNFHKR